jgi:hypothetical protein
MAYCAAASACSYRATKLCHAQGREWHRVQRLYLSLQRYLNRRNPQELANQLTQPHPRSPLNYLPR